MKKHVKMLAPLLALTIITLTGSYAQSRHSHRANRSSSDDTFAMQAAEGGMAEIQMAQLALTKTSNPAVKDLANQIQQDHTKANDDLKPIAAKENFTWPTSLNTKQQSEYQKLQGLSGSAFDREYVNFEIKDHKEDIAAFQREADHGTNAGVKAWASQNLPALQKHLELAQKAQSQLK